MDRSSHLRHLKTILCLVFCLAASSQYAVDGNPYVYTYQFANGTKAIFETPKDYQEQTVVYFVGKSGEKRKIFAANFDSLPAAKGTHTQAVDIAQPQKQPGVLAQMDSRAHTVLVTEDGRVFSLPNAGYMHAQNPTEVASVYRVGSVYATRISIQDPTGRILRAEAHVVDPKTLQVLAFNRSPDGLKGPAIANNQFTWGPKTSANRITFPMEALGGNEAFRTKELTLGAAKRGRKSTAGRTAAARSRKRTSPSDEGTGKGVKAKGQKAAKENVVVTEPTKNAKAQKGQSPPATKRKTNAKKRSADAEASPEGPEREPEAVEAVSAPVGSVAKPDVQSPIGEVIPAENRVSDQEKATQEGRVEDPKKSERGAAKQNTERKRQIRERERFARERAFLAEVEATLKKEFTGYDPWIEKVINRASQILLNPGRHVRLDPIDLIGMPGVGKTLFVNRVAELFNVKDNFELHEAKEGDAYLPVDPIYKVIEKGRRLGKKGIIGVVAYDEIHRVKAPSPMVDYGQVRKELAAQYGLAEGEQDLNRPPEVQMKIEERNDETRQAIEQELAELDKKTQESIEGQQKFTNTIRAATASTGEIPGRAEQPMDELLKPVYEFMRLYAEHDHWYQEEESGIEDELDDLRGQLNETKQELKQTPATEVSEKERLAKEKEKIQGKIEGKKKELREAVDKSIQEMLDNSQIEDGLKKLLSQYPAIFEPFREEIKRDPKRKLELFRHPEDVVLERLQEDPEKTMDLILKTAEGLGPDPKLYAGDMLMFFMGNNVPFNRNAIKGANPMDAGSLAKAYGNYGESEEGQEDMLAFVKRIFGDNEDWDSFASRMGFPWKNLPVWTEEQWKEFARNTLNNESHTLRGMLLDRFGIHADIQFDPSVDKVLLDYGQKPLAGPRTMASAPGDMLGMTKIALVGALLDHIPAGSLDDKVHKIEIHYDYSRKRFVVDKITGAGSEEIASNSAAVLEHAVRPVPKTNEAAIRPRVVPETRRLLASREAARIVFLSLFMGSVPEKITFSSHQPLDPKVLWKHPDPENLTLLEYERNLILGLLAGPASDPLQLGGPLSKQSSRDIDLAYDSLLDLIKTLKASAQKQDMRQKDRKARHGEEEDIATEKSYRAALDEFVAEETRQGQGALAANQVLGGLVTELRTQLANQDGEIDRDAVNGLLAQIEAQARNNTQEAVEHLKARLEAIESGKRAKRSKLVAELARVIPKERKEDLIFKELLEGASPGTALNAARDQLRHLLETSPSIKNLHNQLTDALEAGDTLDAAAIKILFNSSGLRDEFDGRHTEIASSILNDLNQNVPGSIALQSCRLAMDFVVRGRPPVPPKLTFAHRIAKLLRFPWWGRRHP